jgi:hypothetical protein
VNPRPEVHALILRSTAASGVPERLEDAAAAEAVAAILRSASEAAKVRAA